MTVLSSAPMHETGVSRINPRPAWVVTLISVLILALLALFLADRLFHPQKFPIREIEVRGELVRVDGKEVTKIVKHSLDGNYFSLNLLRLERQIEKMPWVLSASLRRQWPSTLVVEIIEVHPVALWGEQKWLNFSGELVNRRDHNLLVNLPLLNGPDSQKDEVWRNFRKWSELFARHGLSLDGLSLDERDLWHIRLSPGALNVDRDWSENEGEQVHVVTMVAQKAHADARIRRFVEALNRELISQFPAMKSVDLRYPNGFAIGWNASAPAAQNMTKSQ